MPSRRALLASLAAVASAGCPAVVDRRADAARTTGLPWDAEPFDTDLVWVSATPALADAERTLSVGDRYGVVVRHVRAPETAIVGAAHVGPSPAFEGTRGEAWLNWGVAGGPSALAYAHELGHVLGYRHPGIERAHDSRLMRPNVDAGRVRDAAYGTPLDPVTLAIGRALPWVDVVEWSSPADTLRPFVARWRDDRLAEVDLRWALRRFDDGDGRDLWLGDPELDVDREGETLPLDGVGQFYRP